MAREKTPYQQSIEDTRAKYPPPAYQEKRIPPTPPSVATPVVSPRTTNDAAAAYLRPPAAPQPGPIMMAVQDVADAARRGAQTSPEAAAGMAVREAVVAPVSRVGEVVHNAVKGVHNRARGVYEGAVDIASRGIEAGRALVTGTPGPITTAAASAPVSASAPAPAAPGAVPQTGVIRGSIPSAMPQPTPANGQAANGTTAEGQPAAADGAPAATVSPHLGPRNVSISILPEEATPSLRRDPVDPNASILASLNDGTWSGMLAARTMAKRLDADRTAAVAAQNAATARFGAETGRMGTISEAAARSLNARSGAARDAAQIALVNEQVKAQQVEIRKREQLETLNKELNDPNTTGERRKQIERELVILHGRQPVEQKSQVQTVSVYDPVTGQKTGEKVVERGQDGTWRDVTPGAQKPQQQGAGRTYVEGKTYVDGNGNKAVYRNGKFEPK